MVVIVRFLWLIKTMHHMLSFQALLSESVLPLGKARKVYSSQNQSNHESYRKHECFSCLVIIV